MSTRFLIAVLALSAAACDGGGGGSRTPPTPTVTGIRVVSGNNQVARVRSAAGGTLSSGVSAAVIGGEEVLDEPLVAQLVVQSGGSTTLMEITGPGGPSLQTTPLPQGWAVNWRTIPEACGRPRVATSNIEDNAGTATNRQVVGTLAGACKTEACAVRGGEIICGADFTFTLNPGPAAVGRRYGNPAGSSYTGSVVLPPEAVQDQYGNPVAFRATTEAGDSLVSVADTTWGSVGSRTINYVDVTGWPRSQVGEFFLVDQAGSRIAKVAYQIPNGVAAFQYVSYSGVVD